MESDKIKLLVQRLAPLVFAAGFAHFGYQFWKHWDLVTLDFRFFWLAGEFWTSGRSPYDAAYAAAAEAEFGIARGAIWYYTPNWFPVAAVLSLPDPLTASRFWLVANAAMSIGAAAFSVGAFRASHNQSILIDPRSPIAAFLLSLPAHTMFFLFAGAFALAQATGNTLHLGQSSMLIALGASLVAFGAARGKLAAAAVGLSIMMLKPQIGILVCASLAFTPFGRRAVVAAAAISILAAAPAFLAMTPAAFLSDFAGGVAHYTDQSYNMPPAVTGARHLVWFFGGADMGSLFYLLIALALICAFGIAANVKHARASGADYVVASLAIAAAASPLHIYDFTLLAAPALFAVSLRMPAGAVCLAALALIWRAGNLPQPVVDIGVGVYYPGSAWASLAVAAISAAFFWTLAFGGAFKRLVPVGAITRPAT